MRLVIALGVVGVGAAIWYFARGKKSAAATTGAPAGAIAPPNTPSIEDPKQAKPAGFNAQCAAVLNAGGDLAVASGNPKAMAAGAAAKMGGPAICTGLEKAWPVTKKAAAATWSGTKTAAKAVGINSKKDVTLGVATGGTYTVAKGATKVTKKAISKIKGWF